MPTKYKTPLERYKEKKRKKLEKYQNPMKVRELRKASKKSSG